MATKGDNSEVKDKVIATAPVPSKEEVEDFFTENTWTVNQQVERLFLAVVDNEGKIKLIGKGVTDLNERVKFLEEHFSKMLDIQMKMFPLHIKIIGWIRLTLQKWLKKKSN